jgi:hypothetical protein
MSMPRTTKFAAAVLGIVCALAALFAFTHWRSAASRNGPPCKLTVPHSSIDPWVFPTKSGSEALDAAIMGNADDSAISRVISEQGGLRVPHGTSCAEIEIGPVYSRVLVVGGPLDGKPVWAPSEHTRGQ